MLHRASRFGAVLALLTAAGCGAGGQGTSGKAEAPAKGQDEAAAVAEERAKLSPEERQRVDAQEYCPVMPDQRLGSMGPPPKLVLQGKPVYLCCKSCAKKAQRDEDKTLAAVEQLKAKVKADKSDKK
jgi:hypothetical protein